MAVAEMSEMRRTILAIIKREGRRSIDQLAAELEVSYEAVRQQLSQLLGDGWVDKQAAPAAAAKRRPVGRPKSLYRLTAAGDHLFPKRYGGLSIALLDAVTARHGGEGLREILGDLADRRVAEWLPEVEGLDLDARLEHVRGIYFDDDPHMSVERAPGGERRLVERNCPFLDVASQRPALCSLTVAVLSRMLGRRVVRAERLQDGDGRCSFLVTEEPADADEPFRFEAEPPEPK